MTDTASCCDTQGCTRAATHYLVAKAWAVGYTAANSPPLTCIIGLRLCKACARAEAASKSVVSEEFWSAIDNTCRRGGRALPDRSSLQIVVKRGDPGPQFTRPTRVMRH